MASAGELSEAERRILAKLRDCYAYDNFTLTIYGQGSSKRRVLDMSWTPRVRLETHAPLAALDE